MNIRFNRVFAVAAKEWRLNLRFATEFFVGNLFTPLKSAIVMIFLYSGFLKASDTFLNSVTKDNYIGYVFLGSILHSQLTNAAGVISGKLICEKYWQTALATLLSPVSIIEVLLGFAIGSGGVNMLVNVFLLTILTLFYPISFLSYCVGLFLLVLMAILGYGLGLIGATVGLVWEGKLFVYQYVLQGVTVLSCLYYPLGVMPGFLQPIIVKMPTYQIGEVMHSLYFGNFSNGSYLSILYMVGTCLVVILAGSFLYNHSVRKFGIVGY